MLQSEVTHLLRGWSDERDPDCRARLREVRVLTEEAIARVNRVGARRQRRLYELILAKITLSGRRAPEAHRLVGTRYVQGMLVYIRIDRHRADTHPTQRALDTTGDGATIC